MAIPDIISQNMTVPVIGAPMFLISTPKLVIAQCKAGIVGCFPSLNARPQSQLKDWIQEIKQGLVKEKKAFPDKKVAPFGVNIVALTSSKRMQEDLQTCIEEEVPIIITSMQAPKEVADAVHGYGGLHFHDVITRRHAEKAAEAGVDGLVLVCAGAGGHAGTLNPFAFVNEVRSFFDGTILLAGALSTGSDILAAQVMGADLAYMGTRFIATEEANAEQAYKDMLIDSGTSDIIYTPQFTGVNASFLRQSISHIGVNPASVSPPLTKKPNKFLLWWKHRKMGRVKKWKELWSAGQGVASISSITNMEELVEQLSKEYQAAMLKVSAAVNLSHRLIIK